MQEHCSLVGKHQRLAFTVHACRAPHGQYRAVKKHGIGAARRPNLVHVSHSTSLLYSFHACTRSGLLDPCSKTGSQQSEICSDQTFCLFNMGAATSNQAPQGTCQTYLHMVPFVALCQQPKAEYGRFCLRRRTVATRNFISTSVQGIWTFTRQLHRPLNRHLCLRTFSISHTQVQGVGPFPLTLFYLPNQRHAHFEFTHVSAFHQNN